MSERTMQVMQGLAVSAGIAIGRAVCLSSRVEEVYRFPVDDVESELERFREAVKQAKEELHRLSEKAGGELGKELAGIFGAHSLMLADDHLVRLIEERIRAEQVNAEWAVWEVQDELRERFALIEVAHLRERGEDVRDVARHLLRRLQGISHHEISEIQGGVIVVADDLTPSDAVRLGRQQVVGFALERGGKTSHTAIIAHSLNIPMVSGLPGVARLVTTEDPVIVDGSSGALILHPTSAVLEEFERRRREREELQTCLLETRGLDSVTQDGVAIHLMANIDLPEELEEAERFGAAGIGLYRSEFLYIEKSPELPSEEEHLALYRRLIEEMKPHPVVVRTYDLGGRKLAREVMHTLEENPVLGLRGIRLTMARPEVFRTQLRGLFRAGLHGDLWIMLPLISTLEEIRRFRHFARQVMLEMERERVPFRRDAKLGAMVEVPSAALIAHHLAQEVDFFSIGTNDLIQYALAVDRNNDHVADLYQPLHPAILRLIAHVVESANRAGIDVAVCGEMAADPACAPLLVGLGIRRLSLNPRMLPTIKAQVRQMDTGELAVLAARCTELATSQEVATLLQSRLPALFRETSQVAEAWSS